MPLPKMAETHESIDDSTPKAPKRGRPAATSPSSSSSHKRQKKGEDASIHNKDSCRTVPRRNEPAFVSKSITKIAKPATASTSPASSSKARQEAALRLGFSYSPPSPQENIRSSSERVMSQSDLQGLASTRQLASPATSGVQASLLRASAALSKELKTFPGRLVLLENQILQEKKEKKKLEICLAKADFNLQSQSQAFTDLREKSKRQAEEQDKNASIAIADLKGTILDLERKCQHEQEERKAAEEECQLVVTRLQQVSQDLHKAEEARERAETALEGAEDIIKEQEDAMMQVGEDLEEFRALFRGNYSAPSVQHGWADS